MRDGLYFTIATMTTDNVAISKGILTTHFEKFLNLPV